MGIKGVAWPGVVSVMIGGKKVRERQNANTWGSRGISHSVYPPLPAAVGTFHTHRATAFPMRRWCGGGCVDAHNGARRSPDSGQPGGLRGGPGQGLGLDYSGAGCWALQQP